MASRKPTGGSVPGLTGNRPEEDERQLFERALAGVRPWRRGANRISSVDFEPERVPAKQTQPSPVAKPGASSITDIQVESAPEGAVGMAFGVSRQTVSGLRRGDFGFDARCDLHKLRAEAARRKLNAFVDECVRRSLRAGLVICGRGLHSGPEGPVLARIVVEALGRPPASRHVLAFAPTTAEQGGPGAIAVLFRRSAG